MNLLHAITLVLLSAVVLMDVKIPNEVRSLGMVPVSIVLLVVVFYLFTQSPVLGVVGLIAVYQAIQNNKVRYIQPQLPDYNGFTPQNQFLETLEEHVVQNMVPMAHTPSPVHLNFKYNTESNHDAAPLG
jgi:hypothetical protein